MAAKKQRFERGPAFLCAKLNSSLDVGRSGSGKSGIIRLLTEYGLDDTGRILVNGRELSGHIDTIRG